ncbi:MAG: phosphatase, partial [Ruminococcus sp.]|nr:phosphatase [Ruminococcus sp.]
HLWHFYNLRVLPEELYGVRILKGMEANIKDDKGTLDIYDESLYHSLEWIVASMHYPIMMPSDKAAHTRAYLGILQNPYVDVIGHSESEQYDYDFEAVAKECSNQGKLIEINVARLWRHKPSWERCMRILEACEKYGTSIVVDSDAHFFTAIGDFKRADELLEEAGFPEKLVFNASEERVHEYLKNRK